MKFSIITLAFTCTIITGGTSATNAKPQRKRTSNNNHISVDTMEEEPYDPFLGLQPDAKNKIMESGGRWRMLQEEGGGGEEEGTEEPTAEEKIPTYAPTAEEKIPTYAPTAGEKIPTYAPTAGDGTDEPVTEAPLEPVTEAPVKAEVVATTMATTIAEEVETTVAAVEEEEVEVIETDMSFPEEESDEGTDISAGAAKSESVNSGSSRALYIAPLVVVVAKTVSIATGFYMMA